MKDTQMAGSRPDLRSAPAPLVRDPVRVIDGPTGPISSFLALEDATVDRATVESFGEEWTRFGQFTPEEIDEGGREYFSDLLPDDVLRGAHVLDVGCGSGRWTRYLAARAAFVEAVDPSRAVTIAARTLADCLNTRVIQASVATLPYAPESFDVVTSIGVLHHTPHPETSIRQLVDFVRPGGRLYLYLYYRLDGRRWPYRAAFVVAQTLRAGISRLPEPFKAWVCDLAAVTIYLPAIAAASLARRVAPGGRFHEAIPLHYYVGKPWKIVRNDARDRLGTPIEHRFSKAEIAEMLERAGLRVLQFGEAMPRWRVTALRP
jgi:SAM-dependent methyltransferase